MCPATLLSKAKASAVSRGRKGLDHELNNEYPSPAELPRHEGTIHMLDHGFEVSATTT